MCQAGQEFACVPYINMFQGLFVCAILTVGNTECYLFIYLFIIIIIIIIIIKFIIKITGKQSEKIVTSQKNK